MKEIGAAKFKEQCLALLDQLDADGLIVTKRGKPVARVVPYDSQEAESDRQPPAQDRGQGRPARRPACAGMPMLNLDTNILIFALGGDLQPSERNLLANSRWSISSIVPWELAKLVQLGRLEMDLDDREVVRVLSRLHVWADRPHRRTCLDPPGFHQRSGGRDNCRHQRRAQRSLAHARRHHSKLEDGASGLVDRTADRLAGDALAT